MSEQPSLPARTPKLTPLMERFVEALAKHDDDMVNLVVPARGQERLFRERLTRWTEQTARTLVAFGLRDAARDLKLVRGEPDFMGDEFSSRRPNALRSFLVETWGHVVAARYALADPDLPQPRDDRIKPRPRYNPDRRVVSMGVPPASHRVPSESPLVIRQHVGDVIHGDKNVNAGSGAIVTGDDNSVATNADAAENFREFVEGLRVHGGINAASLDVLRDAAQSGVTRREVVGIVADAVERDPRLIDRVKGWFVGLPGHLARAAVVEGVKLCLKTTGVLPP